MAIERPAPALFRYYLFVSLLTGPLTPAVLIPLWFRYITLRYKFDNDGVSMRWGILFRKEVYLTYRRIQDIHLTRNILQRWMGLAKISLQTASGSSQAEMAIEGILEAEELRDFLYGKMRGAKNDFGVQPVQDETAGTLSVEGQSTSSLPNQRAMDALVGIRDSLQTLVQNQSTANRNDQGDAS